MSTPVFLPYGVALSFYAHSGKPVGGRHERRVSVASSYVAELVLSENIAINDSLVRGVSNHFNGDNFSRRLLRSIESDGQFRDLAFWIQYTASLKPDLVVLEELSAQGIVRPERRPPFGRTRHRELDSSLRNLWHQWIQSEFSHEPSSHACATLAIALACGAEKCIFHGMSVQRLEDRCAAESNNSKRKQDIYSIFLAVRSVAMGLAGGPGIAQSGLT